MHHPRSKWIRRKSWIKHSRSVSPWVDLLPVLVFALSCVAVLVYLIYCQVTAPAPDAAHPTVPKTPAAPVHNNPLNF